MRTSPDPEVAGLLRVAELMCLAARTAPKACGQDNLVLAVLEEEDGKYLLAGEMRRLGEEIPAPFFVRDADNILAAPVIVLIGSRLSRLNVPGCCFCGHPGCEEAERAGVRCSFNVGDLGLAVGSAVAQAAALHADNRVMFSAGLAAVNLELLGAEVKICYGIPLSATGKNPFFDRK
jgi:uncharacterized ferredoxin-like protein